MDISSSQYNSSASDESGWTHYLDQSYLSENHFQSRGGVAGKGSIMEEEEEEEEDLSMVSDASSGPPHYHEEYDQHYCSNHYPSTSQYTKESEKKKKKIKEYGSRNQQHSLLDDTASSPVLNCSKKKNIFTGNGAVENALDFPQSLSATKKKRKPKSQNYFSFFGRSHGGKQASKEPGGFDEDERK